MSSNKAGTPSRNNRKLVPEPGILRGKEDERAGNSVYHVERFVLLFLNRNARTRNRHFSQGFRESCFYTFQSLLRRRPLFFCAIKWFHWETWDDAILRVVAGLAPRKSVTGKCYNRFSGSWTKCV